MDEMHFGAGRANDRRMAILCILWRVRQPMLHIHSGARTFEQDGPGHDRISCQSPCSGEIPYHYLGGGERPPDCSGPGPPAYFHRPVKSASIADTMTIAALAATAVSINTVVRISSIGFTSELTSTH